MGQVEEKKLDNMRDVTNQSTQPARNQPVENSSVGKAVILVASI